ncbi:hypothetical protein QOZ80_7AG0567200 [Eleusine coracana subsp. coracana]|nr:hypothetical protein QOZ80_7AG0567200 [Eleusine coracana subsp. coracana]
MLSDALSLGRRHTKTMLIRQRHRSRISNGAPGQIAVPQLHATGSMGLERFAPMVNHAHRDPEGVDRISPLPDDLLLDILARLRCARAATHTCLLARRWRRLSTRLPALAFHAVSTDQLDAALATSTCPSLSLLDIRNPCHIGVTIENTRISTWMRAAARLAPAELIIRDVIVRGNSGLDVDQEVELPCFQRTTSIKLEVFGAYIVLLPAAAGDLPLLESLSLESSHVDLGDLVPRYPRLRKLQVFGSWGLDSLKVDSASLQELDVDISADSLKIRHVHIVAPMLKKLRFLSGSRPWRWSGPEEFALSYSAPMVEELYWRCASQSKTDRFGVRWRLFSLTLKTTGKALGHNHMQLRRFPHVLYTLSMSIGPPFAVTIRLIFCSVSLLFAL